jgi:two-component system, chemotaxis family, protein-glutamate methylesterase/glutaminase
MMSPGTRYSVVVIGASWGGLDALTVLLGSLTRDFCASLLIAQHRLEDIAPSGLAGLLDGRCEIPVREADDHERLEQGTAYLAPAGYHLLVQHGMTALSTDAHRKHSRPSVDLLFESAADAYGHAVVAVVLTGANDDGADGVRAVKDAGGFVVAQDPAEAVRPEMPQAAIDTGKVDRVLPLARIGGLLGAACGPAVPGTTSRSASARSGGDA